VIAGAKVPGSMQDVQLAALMAAKSSSGEQLGNAEPIALSVRWLTIDAM